jgi:N-acyl-D-amino-acid deacylase
VLALAAGLKDAGRGVFQMVPDMDIPAEQRFSLLRRIAQVSGRPVSFTFLERGGASDESDYLLQELEQARRDGLEIRGQVIPRPVGALLGLELSYNPFSLNPSYQPIAAAPLAEKVRELRNPQLRARLLAETAQDPNPFFMFVVGDLEEMFVLGDPPNYHPSRQDSVAAQARQKGLDPREFIYDALLRRDGHEILYRPMGNSGGERYEAAGRNLLKRDLTILGLGDGGAHYSLICDAAYPTYLLTYWSRDAVGDRQLPLPWAIKKLTSETATAMGMNDRGLLIPGYKADVNVIDMKRLHLHAPQAAYDLPAGGRRLRQRADGYDATIVSGEITYRDGKPTGALPGRMVRSR